MNNKIMTGVREFITLIGDNPDREGLVDTPKRIANMCNYIFRGYDESKKPEITTISNNSDGVNINSLLIDRGYFFSLCEHHIVPFFGEYAYGYIPDKKVLGVSKIGRTVDYYSARLQVAERLCAQVVNALEEACEPEGSILVMKGRHLCKEMRGVKKYNSPFEVIDARGSILRNDSGSKDEFIARITGTF